MPFQLIMKRKVFTQVQILCDTYEDQYGQKIATASVVNVLLAEALIHRSLIPEDFIIKNYGCADPIASGFNAKAREVSGKIGPRDKAGKKLEKAFSNIIKNWKDLPPKSKTYWLQKARKYLDTVPNAKLILALMPDEPIPRSE
jgi:hypothetical protein